MTPIATIEDSTVIIKILAHLGLPTKTPPLAPIQAYPLFQTACAHLRPDIIRFHPVQTLS